MLISVIAKQKTLQREYNIELVSHGRKQKNGRNNEQIKVDTLTYMVEFCSVYGSMNSIIMIKLANQLYCLIMIFEQAICTIFLYVS